MRPNAAAAGTPGMTSRTATIRAAPPAAEVIARPMAETVIARGQAAMPPARAAVTDMTMTMAWGPMASARNIMVSAQPRANMRAAGFPCAAAGLAGEIGRAAAVCLLRGEATITSGGTARESGRAP